MRISDCGMKDSLPFINPQSAFRIPQSRRPVLSSFRNSTRFPSTKFSMKRKLLDIARRLLILLLVVWTVVSLVTILIELVPGDPAVALLGDQATPEQLGQFRHKLGPDRPACCLSDSADARGGRPLARHRGHQ